MTPESTLAAIRTLERAADSLMRLGDAGNAISLYALALRMRADANVGVEEFLEKLDRDAIIAEFRND